MWRALLVGIGGFVGAVARYWTAGAVHAVTGAAFPFGTLTVNVLGSFLIGLVMVTALERGLIGPDLRLFLTVGILGGFTTMSAFSFETFALVQERSLALAVYNILGSLVLCLLSVWCGATVGRLL